MKRLEFVHNHASRSPQALTLTVLSMPASDPFQQAKVDFIQLAHAKRLGYADRLDFRNRELRCHGCHEVFPSGTVKQCSACKMVLYCSTRCQDLDWKGQAMDQDGHKGECDNFKDHAKKIPVVQEVIKSFPWGRIEGDGTFYQDLVLASFGLLGGHGYGYWSQRSGLSHFEEDEEDKFMIMQLSKSPHMATGWKKAKEEQKMSGFVDGRDLLQDTHLTDKEGWKLFPAFLVPRAFNSTSTRAPPNHERASIKDWDSWHEWRGIPRSSPAALLMHYPLSVYWMLVHTLKITSADAGRQGRVALTVHYLGAGAELNFIPIFSELALLLPYHDLDLVLFGPCVFHLAQTAAKPAYKSSLVARASQNRTTPVFTYTAPKASGLGRLRVFLHTTSKYWDADQLKQYDKPMAVVGCNAGLFTYDVSDATVKTSLENHIPFAVTDYQEYMLETNRVRIRVLSLLFDRDRYVERPIELNPFHRPGQKDNTRDNWAPQLVNGFTLVVS